jgi:hypothetical protein
MILSPYLDDLQKRHQFQANSNDCGPFCAAIILNIFKDLDISGPDLARRMNRIRWKGVFPLLRRVPNWATLPWGIGDVMLEEELPASWRMMRTIYDLFEGLDRNQISIVLVGGYRPLWAHYKILAAHDAVKGWGFINPASPSSDLQWDSHAQFLSLWNKYGRQLIRVSAGT